MIAALAFTFVAPLLVYQAGRKDPARDPRLTIGLLVLTVLSPAFALFLPKWGILPSASGEAAARETFPWMKLLLAIWAAGFCRHMLRLASSILKVLEWTRHSPEIQRMNGVSIRVCRELASPVAVGVRKPVVLVPPVWHEWEEEKRRVILEHELSHHQRRDPLWRVLSAMACAMHWYQPIVHWMARRFVVQSEFACDAAVLRSGIAPDAYARVLCDVAADVSPSPLASAMAERNSLESRVRRLMLRKSMPNHGTSIAALGLLGLLAACSFAMISRRPAPAGLIPNDEIELRLSADPFPGNP